jgi:hypothetical protein
MSSYTVYDKLDVNLAVFRYWDDKPRQVNQILYYDTAMGYYVIEGLPREAFAPGFDIVDDDDEIQHEDLDKKRIKHMMEIYIKALGARDGLDGFSVIGKFQFEDNEDEVLYWVEQPNITNLETVAGTLELRELTITNPVDFATNSRKPTVLTNAQLQKVRLLGNLTKNPNKFRTKIEKIFDDLIALAVLGQQIALLVIRLGSGIRYVMAPAHVLANADTRKEYEDFLENMGMNSTIAVPDGTEIDKGFTFGVEFGDGASPIQPAEHQDYYLTNISIATGVPKEALKGNEIGLRSAETNRQAFLNTLSRMQNDAEDDILWLLEQEFEDEGFVAEGLHLKWKPLVEVDEAEALEILDKKLRLASELVPSLSQMGIELEDFYNLIGLEVNISQDQLNKFEEEKEKLNEQFAGAMNNELSTEDQEKEEPDSDSTAPDGTGEDRSTDQ